jgi:hypothetical protein
LLNANAVGKGRFALPSSMPNHPTASIAKSPFQVIRTKPRSTDNYSMIKVENLHTPHVAEAHILEVHILFKNEDLPESGWMAADPYMEKNGAAVWPFVLCRDGSHIVAIARMDQDGWSYAVLPLGDGEDPVE